MTSRTLQPRAWLYDAEFGAAPSEGSVTLDASNVPYGSADLTIPLTDVSLAEYLDPRTNQRLNLTAWDDAAGAVRAFNLGLRSREVDHTAKTIRLRLETDEAILLTYAPLADIDLWDQRGSLRSVVNRVLSTCSPGAALEASPSPDADVTPRWQQTNLILNHGATDTAGWTATVTGGGAGTVSRTTSAVVREGAAFGTMLRLTMTAASTALASLRYGSSTATNIRGVTPGRIYTTSFWVWHNAGATRSGRIWLGWKNDTNGTVSSVTGTYTVPDQTWTKVSLTAVAPAGASSAAVEVGVSNGLGNGQRLDVAGSMFAEGVRNDSWFNGARANDSTYTYSWTPDASVTPSVRVPIGGEIDPDSLLWPAGVPAWDFLEPLTAGAGLRLFCDENRDWRLIDPDLYSVPGVVSLSPMTTTEGTDLISLADPEVYCTGVVVRYAWTDTQGVNRTKTDTAGTPGLLLVVELNRPWPGAGVAQAILTRRTGQGRVQDVTALAQWDANPAMQASISLPGTLDQIGQVEAVEWGLSNGLMVVRTRALTEIIPGSINAEVGTIDAATGTIDNPTDP